MSHIVVKTVTTALLVGLAIVLPGFDRVMAFLGAFAAFVISVIGPLAAHLKLDRVGRAEKVLDVVLLIVAGSMALTGTVWTFLPLERWM